MNKRRDGNLRIHVNLRLFCLDARKEINMEFKNRRRRAFTQIDNEVLQNNSKLSWKAKGILAVMLSFSR